MPLMACLLVVHMRMSPWPWPAHCF
ncbi:hypothetical protein JMJ77_0008740 [Colletotrichum scovillei]|uniref:Uncharacterized protein n=1 Tax=Colletotrichum scovillei TaxID=1209932 RepID=A0A9P7U629_9PEZI|nr:hypothetical protein JMJ78_0001595 [Colletotrichum scovillei]KAG7041035.1 hypothetical protein JMJ77_0008740 [Colletotrichum scovillei]KAG7061068.1 hypothetical protein JMJ76_0010138 [Colletotrichum scovillei]